MANNNVTNIKRMDIDYAEIWIDSGIGLTLGNLRGKRLYNRLYDCFSSVCRLGKSLVLCFGLEEEDEKPPSCKIPNLIVDMTSNGDYDAKGTATIQYQVVLHRVETQELALATERIFCPLHHHNSPDTNTIPKYNMISTIFKVIPEVEFNCRWVDFKNSHRTCLYAISPFSLVAFPMNSVYDRDNQATIFGAKVRGPQRGVKNIKASCSLEMKKKVYDYFHNVVKHKFAGSLGNMEYIDARVRCMPDGHIYCWG